MATANDQQPVQEASAVTGATKLAASAGAFGDASSAIKGAAGAAGSALGIYTGIQSGTTGGYISAASSAAQLGASAGISGAAEVAGPLAVVAGVYNFAQNYQSGATGKDALQGAESGAAIGTAIMPGIGTVAGAVIGGAVGALASAFGGGATDPETKNWSSFVNATKGANATPQQMAAYQSLPPGSAFNLLSGVMDIKDKRIPIVNAFGKGGETTLLNGMATQINQAYSAGKIQPGATPQQIYSSVVQPWLTSKGATITPETGGLQLQAVLTSLIGSYTSGALTSKTKLTATGSMDTTLPAYAGTQAAQSPVAQSAASQVTSQLLGFPGITSSSSGSSNAANLSLLLTIPGALMASGGSQGAGAPMADALNPNAPGLNTTGTTATAGNPAIGATPTTPSTDGSTGGGFLSTLGSDLSSVGTGISNFLSSPTGTIAEFGTLAGLGIYEAGQQKSENAAQAASISNLGTPFTTAGQGELSQLTGGPQMAGPIGASVAQQTGAATNLGNIAQQYSTGNLTAGQQAQVQQTVAAQKQRAIAGLAAAGITDPNSQQYQTAMEQIDNNALVQTQNLVTQNTQLAEGALQAVNSTYTGLLSQALTSSQFGLTAQSEAVQLQIQGDTQLSTSLQSLFSGIAQGFGNAMRGPSGGTNQATTASRQVVPSPGGGVGGGGGVSSTAAGGSSDPYLTPAQQQETYQQIDQSTQTQMDQTSADIAAQNDAWLASNPTLDPNALSTVAGDANAGSGAWDWSTEI